MGRLIALRKAVTELKAAKVDFERIIIMKNGNPISGKLESDPEKRKCQLVINFR